MSKKLNRLVLLFIVITTYSIHYTKLYEDIRDVAYRNGIAVRADPDFREDMGKPRSSASPRQSSG